jgi:hypothetical protein
MKVDVGAVLMGVVAISLLIDEWDFDRRAIAGQAEVIDAFSGRSGRTIADVVLVVEGQRVRATLRAWYCLLRPGQQVRVLYRPSDPENMVLGWFWQRHYGSTIALTVFTVLAVTEALRFFAWRRRQEVALLRDDYVGPCVGSRGIPSLRIDTAPRLWDRNLDG